MTCGNPIKHKIQNVFGKFIGYFINLEGTNI